MNYQQIEALSTLLDTKHEQGNRTNYSNQEDPTDGELVVKNNSQAGINPLFETVIKTNPVASSSSASSTSSSSAPHDPQCIWSADEIAACHILQDDTYPNDCRIKPQYEILPSHSLTTSDIYSGPSAFSSDSSSRPIGLTVKIELPNVKTMDEISVEVKGDRMLVRSEEYKLWITLGERVDETTGQAKWDEKTAVLRVTLPIVRSADDD